MGYTSFRGLAGKTIFFFCFPLILHAILFESSFGSRIEPEVIHKKRSVNDYKHTYTEA